MKLFTFILLLFYVLAFGGAKANGLNDFPIITAITAIEKEKPDENSDELLLMKKSDFRLQYSGDNLSISFILNNTLDLFARVENVFHIDRPQAHYESESEMRNEFNAICEALSLPSSVNYFRLGISYIFQ
jgi:hypothetical protein